MLPLQSFNRELHKPTFISPGVTWQHNEILKLYNKYKLWQQLETSMEYDFHWSCGEAID